MKKSTSKLKKKTATKAKKRGTIKQLNQPRATARRGVSSEAIEFAKSIWPNIKKSTKFVEVPKFHSSVTYTLSSGERNTTTLMWFSVSGGSRILGLYDEPTDVCYIGEFIKG